jgi:hypothetical protein
LPAGFGIVDGKSMVRDRRQWWREIRILQSTAFQDFFVARDCPCKRDLLQSSWSWIKCQICDLESITPTAT